MDFDDGSPCLDRHFTYFLEATSTFLSSSNRFAKSSRFDKAYCFAESNRFDKAYCFAESNRSNPKS